MDFKSIVKLSIFSIFLFLTTQAFAAHKPAIVCDQPYALCTSAPCIPDPKNPGGTICECVVQKGKNVGFSSCEQRKPVADKFKATHLISTFSFEQFATKKSLSCPKGAPWSNCVDMACTVDPQNVNRAICSCKVDNTQAFFTFGGNCETTSCNTGFWSGAVAGEESDALRDALDKAEGVTTPTSCSMNKTSDSLSR